MPKTSKIMKVAGLSFVGFCAVSLAADKASLAPALSQAAGFCGAFVGALAGRGRSGRRLKARSGEAAPGAVAAPAGEAGANSTPGRSDERGAEAAEPVLALQAIDSEGKRGEHADTEKKLR